MGLSPHLAFTAPWGWPPVRQNMGLPDASPQKDPLPCRVLQRCQDLGCTESRGGGCGGPQAPPPPLEGQTQGMPPHNVPWEQPWDGANSGPRSNPAWDGDKQEAPVPWWWSPAGQECASGHRAVCLERKQPVPAGRSQEQHGQE